MTKDKQNDEALIGSIEPETSIDEIQSYLDNKNTELDALADTADELSRAQIQLDIASAKVGVNKAEEAWDYARNAFNVFLKKEKWQEAVECCDVLYQSGQPASLIALGNGVWLAVTYPVAAQLSVNMLSYIVDETPKTADGAAIAAITAHYIADMRTEGKEHESLTFLTKEMVANVAREHSQVKDKEALSLWMEKLQLHNPDDFLPKLAMVLGAIVTQEQWWYDRDELRKKIND